MTCVFWLENLCQTDSRQPESKRDWLRSQGVENLAPPPAQKSPANDYKEYVQFGEVKNKETAIFLCPRFLFDSFWRWMVMTACARPCFLLYKVRPSETNWFQLLPAICELEIYSHLIKGWTMNKQGRWWQTIIPQSDIPCRNNQELLWDINNKISFRNFHFLYLLLSRIIPDLCHTQNHCEDVRSSPTLLFFIPSSMYS